MTVLDLVERDLIPDAAVRFGIRRRLARRLAEETARGRSDDAFAEELRRLPIAVAVADANEQHYEVPAAFYHEVLGPRLKYSSGLWEPGTRTLAEAEERMLDLYVARVGIEDGHEVLDLGCGWGSFTLYLAERFPRCRVLGVSNAHGQRRHILDTAARRGLTNVDVVTGDINTLGLDRRFDRVVSIEMFEHMKNYERLLARVASWMRPDARLFVHIFTHRRFSYPFEVRGGQDWMARHFFTGGTMPSHDLLTRFPEDVTLLERWWVDGTHYRRTAEAWLAALDERRDALRPVLAEVYGADDAELWRVRWRLFFMACAEMFGYRNGTEWGVSHYLFARREDRAGAAP